LNQHKNFTAILTIKLMLNPNLFAVAEVWDRQKYVPKISFNDVKNRTVELNSNLVFQTLQQTQLPYGLRMLAGNYCYAVYNCKSELGMTTANVQTTRL